MAPQFLTEHLYFLTLEYNKKIKELENFKNFSLKIRPELKIAIIFITIL